MSSKKTILETLGKIKEQSKISGTFTEIGKALNIDPRTVWRYIKKYEIPFVSYATIYNKDKFDKEQLQIICNKSISWKEIGDAINLSSGTARKLILELNIPFKPDRDGKKILDGLSSAERYKIKDPERYERNRFKGACKAKGITPDEYYKMYTEQEGKCKICKKHESEIINQVNHIRKLYIDHCHISGKIRGLICQKCNTGIAMFEDDIKSLQNAISYLIT